MTPQNSTRIDALGLKDFPAIMALWERDESALHPITPNLLRERLLNDIPGVKTVRIAARNGGALTGWAVVDCPVAFLGEGVAGVRWSASDPQCDPEGEIHGQIVAALIDSARSLGAREIAWGPSPPFYLRPGVDARDRRRIDAFEATGWRMRAEHANMSVDLEAWDDPGEAAIFGGDGVDIVRARREDRDALRQYLESRYRPSVWREVSTAFAADPITVFMVRRGGEILGYAAYEVSQCSGVFGPTAVNLDLRGRGLGKRLLWACLRDWRLRPMKRVEIGWIGPAEFYRRHCGAVMGSVFREYRMKI